MIFSESVNDPKSWRYLLDQMGKEREINQKIEFTKNGITWEELAKR